MATYSELFNLRNDPALLGVVTVAVVVAANDIAEAGAATAEQKAWANKAISSPGNEAQRVLYLVLAKNKALTVAQLQAATDAAVQTAVDSVVALLTAGA